MEVELVSGGAISGLRNWLVTLEVVLGAVVDGVSELVATIERTVRPGDGASSVKASGLVEHHLARLSLPDLLPARTRSFGGLLGQVAFLEAVGVQLEDVRRPGDDADALEAVFDVGVASGGRGQDDVASQPSVAGSPCWNGVEEDGDGGVGDLQ